MQVTCFTTVTPDRLGSTPERRALTPITEMRVHGDEGTATSTSTRHIAAALCGGGGERMEDRENAGVTDVRVSAGMRRWASLVMHTPQGHNGFVFSVAYNPDGKRILSGSNDNTVRVWDAQTSKSLRTLKGHNRNSVSLLHTAPTEKVDCV